MAVVVVTLVFLGGGFARRTGGGLHGRPGSRATHGRTPALPPGVVAPWVHVRGTQFVGANGHVVVLRGINAGPSDPAVYKRATHFGVNFVRVPVYWSDIEPNPPASGVRTYDAGALRALGRELRFLRRHRVMALIDLHHV